MFTRVLALAYMVTLSLALEAQAVHAVDNQPNSPIKRTEIAKAEPFKAIGRDEQTKAMINIPLVQPTQAVLAKASQGTDQSAPPLPAVRQSGAATSPSSAATPTVNAATAQSAQATTATTYSCSGPVTQVLTDAAGNLFVSWGSISYGRVCQIGATAPNGYTSDACKAIYAQMLVAQVSNQPMTGWFSDNLSCTTQTAWGWLNGLYTGPGKN